MKGRHRALIYTIGTQSAVCEHPTGAYGSIRAIDAKNIRNPATQRCVCIGRSWDRLSTGRCGLSPSELKYGSSFFQRTSYSVRGLSPVSFPTFVEQRWMESRWIFWGYVSRSRLVRLNTVLLISGWYRWRSRFSARPLSLRCNCFCD